MADNQTPGEEESQKNLNLVGVRALSNEDWTPDPWYRRFGMGLAKTIVKALLFVFGILLDVLIGLWNIIKGFFIGIYKFFRGIKNTCVKTHRIWNDVDGWGKASFFLQGLGHLKRKQWLDGFVFMGMEILFLVYMAVGGLSGGVVDLANFFGLNVGSTTKYKSGVEIVLAISDSRPYFIWGFVAIVIVVAYAIVYVKGIQGMYDNYQIVHELEFRQAREDAYNVLTHREEYAEDLTTMNAFQIKRLMRDKYGYSELSARYISHVPFKRIPDKAESGWEKVLYKIEDFFYGGYDRCRKWILRFSEWVTPLSRFLDGRRKVYKSRHGYAVVEREVRLSNIKFRHTYDKYNNYLSFLRDQKALLAVYSQPEAVYAALFARDHVSEVNGIAALPENTKLKTKEVVSRLVGAFEIPLDLAKEIGQVAVNIVSEKQKALGSDLSGLQAAFVKDLTAIKDQYQARLDAFVRVNADEAQANAEGLVEVYARYTDLRPFYDQGKAAFIGALINGYHLTNKQAKEAYRDYTRAIKENSDDEARTAAALEKRSERLAAYETLVKDVPFHGQPTPSLKRIKEFGDEKFAVTVLSLPTLSAVIVCIVPLLCSIAVAFTNWDQFHTSGRFVWDVSAFNNVLNLFGTSSEEASYSYTFFHLLKWTLIWAVFATFTNYFFGILLALMINRKSIKLKKMWRTIFVITIAIPQFISLLCISLLLSSNGAVNSWLLTQGWYADGGGMAMRHGWGIYDAEGNWIATGIPFLGNVSDPGVASYDSFYPKLTCILVNMWVGIPYTMLSTSGILMNIPEDLYESAKIDGAGPARQLFSITMPYVFFVTGPALLTQFIGNINNFNVIYFLTGGAPTAVNPRVVTGAGETDLLITWLYKMTVNYSNYSIASVIGILVFVVCAFFSLIIYGRLGSVKNEEEFQ
jgi:ABC-type sugar transport system permease subunit